MFKINSIREVAKIVEYEDLRLTSLNEHTKTEKAYRATICKSNLQTTRRNPPRLEA